MKTSSNISQTNKKNLSSKKQNSSEFISKNKFSILEVSEDDDESEDMEEIIRKKKQVFHEDKDKVSSMLEAIMERLKNMELRQEEQSKQMNLAIAQSQQAQFQLRPAWMASPTVPQPGTQTQAQWGSQSNLATQSQGPF